MMINPNTKKILKALLLVIISVPAFLLISCGRSTLSSAPAVIEETEGGREIIEAEFSECEGEEIPNNPMDYTQFRQSSYKEHSTTCNSTRALITPFLSAEAGENQKLKLWILSVEIFGLPSKDDL